MQTRWAVLAFFLFSGLCIAAEPAKPSKSPWLTDYAAARLAARASGKPIFVVFRCEH